VTDYQLAWEGSPENGNLGVYFGVSAIANNFDETRKERTDIF
jgi:hypothetical protein